MPIYEFRCHECHEKFSELRKIGDDKNVECPHCSSINTGKMISSFSRMGSNHSSAQCSPTGGG